MLRRVDLSLVTRRGDGTMDIRSPGGTEYLYLVEQWARDHQPARHPGLPAPGGRRGLVRGTDQRFVKRPRSVSE